MKEQVVDASKINFLTVDNSSMNDPGGVKSFLDGKNKPLDIDRRTRGTR